MLWNEAKNLSRSGVRLGIPGFGRIGADREARDFEAVAWIGGGGDAQDLFRGQFEKVQFVASVCGAHLVLIMGSCVADFQLRHRLIEVHSDADDGCVRRRRGRRLALWVVGVAAQDCEKEGGGYEMECDPHLAQHIHRCSPRATAL